MLDHVFTDAIGALRDAFEGALLERQAFEERFHTDVLLGDMTWETSYGLPGEGLPPRVQADITLTWPTWAQTAGFSSLTRDFRVALSRLQDSRTCSRRRSLNCSRQRAQTFVQCAYVTFTIVPKSASSSTGIPRKKTGFGET